MFLLNNIPTIYFCPVLFLASIVVLFFIEAGRVKRRNEFGLEVFKTATGAVAGGYLLIVLGRIARIGLIVGALGTVALVFA